jgi:hypothetical protein
MTAITGKQFRKMKEALDTNCSVCSSYCPFDGDDCLLITIKELLAEHVKEKKHDNSRLL